MQHYQAVCTHDGTTLWLHYTAIPSKQEELPLYHDNHSYDQIRYHAVTYLGRRKRIKRFNYESKRK